MLPDNLYIEDPLRIKVAMWDQFNGWINCIDEPKIEKRQLIFNS